MKWTKLKCCAARFLRYGTCQSRAARACREPTFDASTHILWFVYSLSLFVRFSVIKSISFCLCCLARLPSCMHFKAMSAPGVIFNDCLTSASAKSKAGTSADATNTGGESAPFKTNLFLVWKRRRAVLNARAKAASATQLGSSTVTNAANAGSKGNPPQTSPNIAMVMSRSIESVNRFSLLSYKGMPLPGTPLAKSKDEPRSKKKQVGEDCSMLSGSRLNASCLQKSVQSGFSANCANPAEIVDVLVNKRNAPANSAGWFLLSPFGDPLQQ